MPTCTRGNFLSTSKKKKSYLSARIMITAKGLYSPEVTIVGVQVVYQKGKCLSQLGSGYPSVLFLQHSFAMLH